MKSEPKTVKAKADLMLKRGSISEKEHKRIHAKADAAKSKKAKPDDLSAEGGDPEFGKETGKDTSAADNPSGKYRKRGSDRVMRGQPIDEEERDL